MEIIIEFIRMHAHQAHWIIFFLLLLAGLNIPISEDVLLIIGGVIANTCLPNETYHLFAWILLGCLISGWEAYWLGRLLGPKIYDMPFFRHVVNPQSIEKLNYYYEKFGIFTFIAGRFIPGGVRNALFMTSGLAQMPFPKFVVRDAIACCFSATTIFTMGYYFGENYEVILHYLNKVAIGCISLILLFLGFFLWQRRIVKNPLG